VISEVFSCNNASTRYIFKGEKHANLAAQARTNYQLAINSRPPKHSDITENIRSRRRGYEAFGEWKVAEFVKDDAVHPGQMLRDAALPSATGRCLEDSVL
jgi:hypothetical protein